MTDEYIFFTDDRLAEPGEVGLNRDNIPWHNFIEYVKSNQPGTLSGPEFTKWRDQVLLSQKLLSTNGHTATFENKEACVEFVLRWS